MEPPAPIPSSHSPLSPMKRLRLSAPSSPPLSLPTSVDAALTDLCRRRDLPSPSPDALRALAFLGEDAALDVVSKLAASADIRSLTGYIMYLARRHSSAFSPARRLSSGDGVASSPGNPPPGGDHLILASSYPGSCVPAPGTPGASDRLVVASPSASRVPALGTARVGDRLAAASLSPVNNIPPPCRVGLSDLLSLASSSPGNHRPSPPRAGPIDQIGVASRIPSKHLHTPGREAPSAHLVALGELEFRKSFLILSYIGKCKLEETVSVEMIRRLKSSDMSSFERNVWQDFGRRCIQESDRILGLDWYTDRTYIYRCYVDAAGGTTFKGPYLQQTKTHLQKVLGDDMVMLVNFEGEGKDDMYNNIIKNGILVGLRRYRFFVYKDGGKEKKNANSSSVRCYFVCTESESAIDNCRNYILFGKSISEARSIFMHVHMVPNMAKYMARFSLILSKTSKLAVNLDDVTIEYSSDICAKDENGQNIEKAILSDGTGFISEDLALMCPCNIFKGQHLRSSNNLVSSYHMEHETSLMPNSFEKCPPLLIQCRIFKKGCAIKGTLLVNKTLSPRTIVVRDSMVKVKADEKMSGYCADSFEIVTTSNPPKRSFLSKTLIALLNYGGVPKEYFLKLVSTALDELHCGRAKKKTAVQVALRYVDMGGLLVARMIMCGIPLDEPYMDHRLSFLLNLEKSNLRSGRIPVTESFYLMGTADPTGKLNADEVCVILEHGHISGDVLVYRNPGLHFGDIHILKARYVEELDGIVGKSKFGIFFPTKGCRSVADEMAGGDFDGDMYWVSKDTELLKHFSPKDPWVETNVEVEVDKVNCPRKYSDEDLEKELFQQFLNNRFKPNFTMGIAADSWHSYMDRLLTLSNDCEDEKRCLHEKMLQLIDIYYDALDAPKTGKLVKVPSHLIPEKFPHYMEKPSSFQSTSVIGLIYDMVKMHKETLPSQGLWKLPCFNREISPDLLDKWTEYYTDYRREMTKALSSDDKEAKDAAAEKVKQKYKQKLYEAPEFEETQRPKQVVFDEALAIYHVVYDHAAKHTEVGKCSFVWEIAGHALCELHASMQEKSEAVLCLRSVLNEIL